jgi:hypothetical protein
VWGRLRNFLKFHLGEGKRRWGRGNRDGIKRRKEFKI